MAGNTTKVFNAVSAPVNSAAIACQRVREENGPVEVIFVGTSFSMSVQGRSDPTAPWFTIKVFTQADTTTNGAAAAIIALFPEIRFSLTAIVAGTLTAYLME
jgi:hypothetical protein